MKKLLPFFLFLLFIDQLAAQPIGPFNGSQFNTRTLVGSSSNWNNAGNMSVDDGSYASFADLPNTTGAYTDYITITGFGFSIPPSAIVTGILVEIERSDPNQQTSDYSVRIIRKGIIGAAEKSTGLPYPATDSYQSYGGSTDTWGETWSYKEIGSSSFGVAIAAQRSATGGISAGQIDNVRVTIFLQTPVSLPVVLNSFNATKNNNNVLVKWSTSEENNINQYVVERSHNGRDFSPLGIVFSRNSSIATSYSFTDPAPVKGGSWYRLRIIEQSGTHKYSPIAAIVIDDKGKNSLYPTAITEGQTLFISNAGQEALKVQFYNNSGQAISETTTTTGQLPAQSLIKASGIVYYRITNTKGMITGSGRVVLQ
ncbi:MAG TPA: hypothetical protein VHM26_05470 [Chitinophagaceae bacterium]|jgi:hypothetical protein|nr:hypothetical protein [Chitinophagaceae bacterium]